MSGRYGEGRSMMIFDEKGRMISMMEYYKRIIAEWMPSSPRGISSAAALQHLNKMVGRK
jgi:hypothetical protein